MELDFDIPESSDNTEEQKPPAMESLKVLVSDDDRSKKQKLRLFPANGTYLTA